MSRIVAYLLLAALAIGALPGVTAAQSVPVSDSTGFADAAFESLWTRADAPVASGSARRSWVWGALPGERRYERYLGRPEGVRLVQYFDKARMEINDPAGDRTSPWFVTNGLLVVEMIRGQLQVEDTTFEPRSPAQVPVVGDPLNNPAAPTYAALAPLVSTGSNSAPDRTGQRVSATLGPDGVGEQPDLAAPETEIVRYEAATGRNLPRVFDDFLRANSSIVDPLFAFGYPITEPYWSRAVVGGQEQWVLFQAFERRVLSYNPANPDPWKVEMGNVGQHYVRWRYGRPPGYAQPVLPEGIRSYETTLEIPTYAYEQALVPTEPGDPIYPYARLDFDRVGPPELREHRAFVMENRFLELTFLPDLGGRLYRAVNKATGDNLFYQNPVIKPSPFGQRGWWLGVGGVEYAAPTEEHGYLEYLPWEMELFSLPRSRSVIMQTTEQQTGLEAESVVALRYDEGRFGIQFALTNNTGSPHPVQSWTNAMLAPGAANRIEPGFHFVMPTDQIMVHATQDAALPEPQELFSWPLFDGRDMSYPANWNGYVGAFAPDEVSFFGAYDTRQDAGVAIVDGITTTGAKIFAFSEEFDRSLFTDDGSDYAELWSGPQRTFWDYPELLPGGKYTVSGDWLPLWGIGDLSAATSDAALGVTQRPDGGTTVALATAEIIEGAEVVVRVDGREVFRTAPLDLRPDQPLAIDLPFDASGQQIEVEAPGLLLTFP